MRHVVLERWSRGESWLHRRDPRAKTAALLVYLVVLATAHRRLPVLALVLLVLLSVTIVTAHLPLLRVLVRAGVVLAFTAVVAVSSWLSGDTERAIAIVLKSYLSALAVILVMATTPMPLLLRGLEASGAPRFLLMVIQFVYRYLFVIADEAGRMRTAALSRGGTPFRAAAGALAALFARSYGRAEEIHRAMLARGFTGRFRPMRTLHFQASDAAFVIAAALAPVLARWSV